MTHHIRISPSGHEFIAVGNNTILEAGLSAGLRLGYGCSNGNCGECLARIVSGEVEKTRYHDYAIGEARTASGHILMCCNSALSDVELEAVEASSANEIPQQQIITKVKNINIVNNNVALVHLKTPRTNRLRFLAGQHVTLGGNATRHAIHTVASCPCDDMNLHFQIPLDLNDDLSNHVFNDLKSSDKLEINGPGGDFILDEDSPRSLVFIAWRTGFAPIRSLIEHAMALEVAEAMHLVWIAEGKEDRYFDNLCRSWADALDDFSYLPLDAEAVDLQSDTVSSFIEQLEIEPENLVNHDFYVAGNQQLLTACKQVLSGHNVNPNQLNLDDLLHD